MKHYGALKLQGSYIHCDYDLYDIIDITQPQRNLAAVGNRHPSFRFPGRLGLLLSRRAANIGGMGRTLGSQSGTSADVGILC